MGIVYVAGLAAWASCALLGQVALVQSFEVASIRLHTDQVRMVGLDISGPRVTISAFSVSNLVEYAYNLKMYQVVGGPDWATSDRYDIVAKAEGDAALTRDRMRPMMQALLADRFQAKVHRETRELPVFALVRAKNGAKLRENNDPEAKYSMAMRSPKQDVFTTTTKGTMQQLADQLSGNIRRPVLDKTGLTGTYDYTLEWLPDNAAAADSNLPSIYTAVEEQLGLKLEATKAPIEVVVIDHVEKPSAN
jgi:uncharacterized protein (TIGR03435 family)